jgi:hypothetical protein
MNRILVAALAVVFAAPAFAGACHPNDFAVKNFKIKIQQQGGRRRLKLSGELINHCSRAAGAQIRIVAKDKRGKVIERESGWPTGSTNIPPGASVKFNLGALFRYDPSMASFSAAIIAARSW